MFSRYRRYWALALGAATVASAAIAATPSATWAAVSPPHTFSGEEAGFQAFGNGWHFRYVQGQITLPDVTGAVDSKAFPGYGISVRLSNAASSAVLGISTSTGGSASTYSPAFNFESAVTNLPGHNGGVTIGTCKDFPSVSIAAGDTVRLSLFFDGSHLAWTVTDLTTAGKNVSGSCTDPLVGDLFDHAQIGTEFGITPWDLAAPSAVSGNFRLATVTNTVVTNRTGIRGSAGVGGGWPVQNMVLTDNGLASGQVRTSTPFAWGSYATAPDNHVRDGRNFGVWLPSKPA